MTISISMTIAITTTITTTIAISTTTTTIITAIVINTMMPSPPLSTMIHHLHHHRHCCTPSVVDIRVVYEDLQRWLPNRALIRVFPPGLHQSMATISISISIAIAIAIANYWLLVAFRREENMWSPTQFGRWLQVQSSRWGRDSFISIHLSITVWAIICTSHQIVHTHTFLFYNRTHSQSVPQVNRDSCSVHYFLSLSVHYMALMIIIAKTTLQWISSDEDYYHHQLMIQFKTRDSRKGPSVLYVLKSVWVMIFVGVTSWSLDSNSSVASVNIFTLHRHKDASPSLSPSPSPSPPPSPSPSPSPSRIGRLAKFSVRNAWVSVYDKKLASNSHYLIRLTTHTHTTTTIHSHIHTPKKCESSVFISRRPMFWFCALLLPLCSRALPVNLCISSSTMTRLTMVWCSFPRVEPVVWSDSFSVPRCARRFVPS